MKAKVIETGEIIDVQCLCSVTYSQLDCNHKIVAEYDEEDLDFNFNKSSLDTKHLFDFDGKWELSKYPPKEDGFYMTIRCGLNGIYTHVDQWKENRWKVGILDDSDVIAYSSEQISKEQIQEWIQQKQENSKYK